MGIVAFAAFGIGKMGDEFGGFGTPGGLQHVFLSGIGAAVDDIVAHRAVQQAGVLRDQADLGAQAFLGNVFNVLPVDADLAALRLVEAQ